MSWHRSRTPHGNKSSEWISRQVAGLGRYPDKRPAGLRVDASGAFELTNLMQTWGQSQGLSEEDVRNALIEHQGHEGGRQRFTLEYDKNDWSKTGDFRIRVHQRSHGGGGWQQNTNARADNHHTPPEADAWRDSQPKADAWWSESSPSSQQQPSESSSRLLPTPNRAFNLWNSGTAESSDERKGVWDDDTKQDPEASEKSTQPEWWEHDDRKSNDNEWWKKEDSGREKHSDSGSKTWDKGTGEQIQRWLGWVLKSGHRDVGVYLRDREWGSLDILAETLSTQKPQLNVNNASDLQDVIEKTDAAGRFEIKDGEVRKVQRDSRVTRSGEDSSNQWWEKSWDSESTKKDADKSWASQEGHQKKEDAASTPWRSPSKTASKDVWSLLVPNVMPTGESETANSQMQRSPGREHSNMGNPQDQQSPEEPADFAGAPPAPPGPHWKKYVDDGFFWWFYEGPLGKWWCQGEDMKIEPWPDDAEE